MVAQLLQSCPDLRSVGDLRQIVVGNLILLRHPVVRLGGAVVFKPAVRIGNRGTEIRVGLFTLPGVRVSNLLRRSTGRCEDQRPCNSGKHRQRCKRRECGGHCHANLSKWMLARIFACLTSVTSTAELEW